MVGRTVFWVVGFAGFCMAAADEPPERLRVATWNLEWFFDDHTGDNFQPLPVQQSAPSAEAWEWKLGEVAGVIARIQPTILALQEIENRRVLFYLTRKLKNEYGLDYSVAFIEGDDYFTEQDVAVLAQSGLAEFSVRRQSREMFDSQQYYNLSKHLFCSFAWTAGDRPVGLSLVNLHLRAAPEAAAIRQRQARLVRRWVEEDLAAGKAVIVLGDLNSDETFETTSNAGELGILRGLHTAAANDDLADLFQFYAGANQETHLIHKQFDRILVSPVLLPATTSKPGYAFERIEVRRDLVIRGERQDADHQDVYWKIPAEERDVSDHYPVVAEFGLRR